MKANMEKVYAKFTAEERLSLLIEAAARRDRAETDLLWDTAPLVSMRGTEPALMRKWTELDAFTSAVVITLQSLISCFYAAHTLHTKRDSFALGWIQAGGKPEKLSAIEKDDLCELTDDEISAALKARAGDVLTFASAVDTLCEEIGFSRSTLITAFVSPAHCERIDLDLLLISHMADGIDESLEADFLCGLRERHPVLFREIDTPPNKTEHPNGAARESHEVV